MLTACRSGALLALAALSWLPTSTAFYLPGSAPTNYLDGDAVPVLVNKLSPAERGMVSYDYYDERNPFCRPEDEPRAQSESLGSVLFGDRLYESPLSLRMGVNSSCSTLCVTTLDKQQSIWLDRLIAQGYFQNWLIDGLPVGQMKYNDDDRRDVFYTVGFPIGNLVIPQGRVSSPVDQNDIVNVEVFNHLQIWVFYHHPTPNSPVKRVVGVAVWPSSIDSLAEGGEPDCSAERRLILKRGQPTEIAFTYSVNWVEDPVTPWATRWDSYLRVTDPRVHVLSLANSIVIAVFLLLMVGSVLLRTVKRDVQRYTAVDLDEDVQEDFGWKLVANEVFRAPRKRTQLSLLVGSGAQITAMAAVTLVFALLGFLSPANRGALTTMMLVCWNVFGSVAGYVSARLYASIRGEEYRKNIAVAAFVPGFTLLTAVFFLNLFLIGVGSSGAIPFGTFVALGAMWLFVNVPLCVLGGYVGHQHGAVFHPARVNQIPRQIPILDWWLKPLPSMLISGILPAAAAWIEFYFVIQSLFGSKVYIAFGALALTSLVVWLTAALTTCLMIYFCLCAEDYRWHWRSFVCGGGGAVWLLVYGLIYRLTRLSLPSFTGNVLFLGYLILISAFAFVTMGTVGFISSYAFLKLIYSRIRVD